MNHGHQPGAQSPRQHGNSLAMLDFVVLPHSFPFSLLRWQRRATTSPFHLAALCAFTFAISSLTGCTGNPANPAPSLAVVRQERKAQQSRMDAARQQLEQIPPPSKSRYLGIRSQDAYTNPFLVVHPQTITLTIIYRDQDPNGFTGGGLLRPAKARKQEVDLRPQDLPEALSSLSPDVWPYGRVVAIEESPTAPKTERVAIRRNVESAIQVLNDLGVVVDEWTGPNGALLR